MQNRPEKKVSHLAPGEAGLVGTPSSHVLGPKLVRGPGQTGKEGKKVLHKGGGTKGKLKLEAILVGPRPCPQVKAKQKRKIQKDSPTTASKDYVGKRGKASSGQEKKSGPPGQRGYLPRTYLVGELNLKEGERNKKEGKFQGNLKPKGKVSGCRGEAPVGEKEGGETLKKKVSF